MWSVLAWIFFFALLALVVVTSCVLIAGLFILFDFARYWFVDRQREINKSIAWARYERLIEEIKELDHAIARSPGQQRFVDREVQYQRYLLALELSHLIKRYGWHRPGCLNRHCRHRDS